MRFLMVILISVMTGFAAQAQQMPDMMQKLQSMSPEEQQQFMNEMMKSASHMQACYEAAGGEEGMKELEARGRKLQADVEALCAAGERDKAHARAQAEATRMMQDPRAANLQKCAQDLSGKMPFMQELADPESYLASNHICDIKEDES